MLFFLRVKGYATPEALATASGLAVSVIEPVLLALKDSGAVRFRERPLAAWSMTAEARLRHGERLAAERGGPWFDDVLAVYEEFKTINADALLVFFNWQMRPAASGQVPNDHTDAGYDDRVIARLEAVNARVAPLLDRVGAMLPRFCPYAARLSHAVSQVRSGAGDWFTRPLMDSYHTVWFELHEDLLLTLGIERSEEESAQ